MRIGLIDVDGHNFPNLALMRISAYHKAKGDTVDWWWGWDHYDVVYMSKVFSDAYSPDIDDPPNTDAIVRGGTGYAISLKDGREVFDQSKNVPLIPEAEAMFPDYSLYPQYPFAVAMTSRGCPRGCPFCHVAAKEGRNVRKVADVSDFWNGQKLIRVMDSNITACPDKRDLLRQYRDTGAWIDFFGGLDIRFLDDDDIADLNAMKIKLLHFAWDNPNDDLEQRFASVGKKLNADYRRRIVYVLVNHNSTIEQDLHRIYTLRDLGYSPFVMVYNRPTAPKEIKRLQRWCNSNWILRSVPKFEDYKG